MFLTHEVIIKLVPGFVLCTSRYVTLKRKDKNTWQMWNVNVHVNEKVKVNVNVNVKVNVSFPWGFCSNVFWGFFCFMSWIMEPTLLHHGTNVTITLCTVFKNRLCTLTRWQCDVSHRRQSFLRLWWSDWLQPKQETKTEITSSKHTVNVNMWLRGSTHRRYEYMKKQQQKRQKWDLRLQQVFKYVSD